MIKTEIQNQTDSETAQNAFVSSDKGTSIKQDFSDLVTANLYESTSDFIEFLDNNQLLVTCRLCSKSFGTIDGLKCHKRLHTGDLFKCKTCGKEYTRMNHLQRHELSHGKRKIHICKICSKTLTRFEHLKRHLMTHLKEKPFSCKSCGRGFSRSEHLQNHLQRCKGEKAYVCEVCNKSFNRPDTLQVHMDTHDNKTPQYPTLDNLDNIEEHYYEVLCNDFFEPPWTDSEGEEEEGEEDSWGRNFNGKTNTEEEYSSQGESENARLRDGFKVKEGNNSNGSVDVENCGDYEKRNEGVDGSKVSESEESNLKNDNGEIVKKTEENRVSDSSDSDYNPKRIVVKKKKRGRKPSGAGVRMPTGRPRGRPRKVIKVDEESVFKCDVCGKSFTKLSLLETHKEYSKICNGSIDPNAQNGVKIHKCDVCNREFNRSNHLKRHMLCHLEVKPYSCEICTKDFTRKDHLTLHMRLHDKSIEMYDCDMCEKKFTRTDHLVKHKAAKHGIGERVHNEKKYKCNICDRAFTTKKYRDVHLLGHMGEKKFQCKTCEKTFLSKSHLTEHMKFHNDNSKKYLCSECGQRFIRNDYLIIHMRRHRGEKPFKCKYCGKGESNSNLNLLLLFFLCENYFTLIS